MRHLLLATLLSSLVLASGCGGSKGGGGGGDPLVPPAIYVDAVNGSNVTGTGEVDKPFKTIKRGIQGAPIGTVVHVLPGTYDAANGETFPIIPGFGITIVGTTRTIALNKTWQSNVVGGGLWSGDLLGRLHATFVPNDDNVLKDLAIMNPQPFVVGGAKPASVVMGLSGATLDGCLLHDSDKGVRYVEGVSNSLITNCRIVRNGIGLFPEALGTGNIVERCRISENGAGVLAFADGLDLGGGAAGSVGLNVFAGNGQGTDVIHFSGNAIPLFAENCLWDHNPPTRGVGQPPSVADADVWEGGTGPVVTTNPQVFIPMTPFVVPPIVAVAE